MAEIMKKEADVKKSEITLTVEDICFVKIPEDNIKLENTGIQGKLNNSTLSSANIYNVSLSSANI